MPKKSKISKGALLIEALIATTILAVGVVASLRVFSGSLSASNRSIKTRQVHQVLNDQIFKWFLDPTSFDTENPNYAPQTTGKNNLNSQYSFVKLEPVLSQDESRDDDSDKEAPAQRPLEQPSLSQVQFYQVSMQVVSSNQKREYQNFFYLAQYGNANKT